MATTADQLARVQALIQSLEEGGAVEEYSETSEKVRRTTLKDLYAREETLIARLAAETGGSFHLGEPFQS